MLVELGLVEQRLKAVHEVLDGATVVDVAERYGVARQTVHTWLKNYSTNGMSGLVDKTSKPGSCPHQMGAVMEARIVELRRAHPRWGPQRILDQLAHDRETDLPGRSSIYRCLVRHGLIDPQARKRRKSDYKRWERSRPMELWQMDIVGGVMLADGWKASIVSGIDDHSRFIVSAQWFAGRRPDRLLTRWRKRCELGVSLRRSSLTTAKCSRPGSGPAMARCCSIGSWQKTGSNTG